MKRSLPVKGALWVGIVLAFVAAVVWSLRPQPVPVTSALVTRGTIAATVSGEGRTRVRDLYVITAPVDGHLERVSVQPGDKLEVDDGVATIQAAASRPLDPRSRAEASAAAAAAKAAVARAEATAKEARVAFEHANSELETTRKLAQKNAVAKNELLHHGHESERRRRALDAAMEAVRQARAELARANAVLGTGTESGEATLVRSPAAGEILRVVRESAGPIAAGTPLVEVGDIRRLEVDADLLSSDAAEVRPGAKATITNWGGARPLDARVRRIDPAAFTKVSALGLEEQRVHVLLDLTDPPPPGLGHDYRVDVAVVVWEGHGALRVPSTALFRNGEQWSVFTARDGRARLASVEVGRSDGTWTAVLRGLSENTRVVVQPSDEIKDGTRLRVEPSR